MSIPVTVSEHDLLGLLSIVSDHRADDPGDACRCPCSSA